MSWSLEGRLATGLAIAAASPVAAALACAGNPRALTVLGAITVVAVLSGVWISRSAFALIIRTRREKLEAESNLDAARRETAVLRRIVHEELAPQVQVIDGFTRILESSYQNELHRDALRILAKTRASATVMRRAIDTLTSR
jgi:hypothetical protein